MLQGVGMGGGGASQVSSDYGKYDKLLRELEEDSVDTDILDDELRSLQATAPRTCRGRTVHWLGSGPVHLVVCILIMVDAGIVIAEILMDLHAMRSHYMEASTDVIQLIDFLKEHHLNADEIIGNFSDAREDVDQLIERLRNLRYSTSRLSPHTPPPSSTLSSSSSSSQLSFSRNFTTFDYDANLTLPSLQNSNLGVVDSESDHLESDKVDQVAADIAILREMLHFIADDARKRGAATIQFNDTTSQAASRDVTFDQPRDVTMSSYLNAECRQFIQKSLVIFESYRDHRNEEDDDDDDKIVGQRLLSELLLDGSLLTELTLIRRRHTHSRRHYRAMATISPSAVHGADAFRPTNSSEGDVGVGEEERGGGRIDGKHSDRLSYARTLQCAAHVLHYVSIVILGLFALQVLVKIYAMGSDFFRNKMEMFDGAITLTSFALDVTFLEGVTVAQGEEAIALLIVFLLWRILRLVNGLLVAAKQRQEFRIKLQKRGRIRSEKKASLLEMEINRREREIDNLIRLCNDKGISREEISACRPRQSFRRLNASTGLSSVASFSLGLSMSMRGPTAGEVASTPSPAGSSADRSCSPSLGAQAAPASVCLSKLSSGPSPSETADSAPRSISSPPAVVRHHVGGLRRISSATTGAVSPSGRRQSFQDLFPIHTSATSSNLTPLMCALRRTSPTSLSSVGQDSAPATLSEALRRTIANSTQRRHRAVEEEEISDTSPKCRHVSKEVHRHLPWEPRIYLGMDYINNDQNRSQRQKQQQQPLVHRNKSLANHLPRNDYKNDDILDTSFTITADPTTMSIRTLENDVKSVDVDACLASIVEQTAELVSRVAVNSKKDQTQCGSKTTGCSLKSAMVPDGELEFIDEINEGIARNEPYFEPDYRTGVMPPAEVVTTVVIQHEPENVLESRST